MKRKLLIALLAITVALCCALGLVACDKGGDTVAVTSVALNKTELTLEIDGEETLTATVKPDNATNNTVTWASSVPTVATVANGKVTAIAAGTATITATADGKKAECTVTVNAAATKMSEQEWQSGLNAFATAKNFHLMLSVLDVTAGEVKMNGDTYYDKGGNIERIFIKDGNKYYRYDKMNAEADWTKAETTEAIYNEIVNSDAYNLVLGGSQAFGSNYASFDYSDGKYTAATISVAAGFTLKDIEVTVVDGAVKKIVCTQVGVDENPDTIVTINGIGTTEITLPKIKEPTSCVQYRIPKNKDYAVVSGYSPKTEDDLDVLIADTYQGKPVTIIETNSFSSGYAKSVIIPDSVTTIESSAFARCSNLAKITVPDSVTNVGNAAFEKTPWLEAQPDGLVYVGKVAYLYKGDKTALTSIEIADGTKSISPLAFHECEQLTEVVIPDSVTTIGGSAFYDCIRLTNVTLGKGVESIEAQAFRNCKLTNITLPVSVKDIGSWVFAGCGTLTINYSGKQEQWTAIKKHTTWNGTEEGTINCTVKCTDGDISK